MMKNGNLDHCKSIIEHVLVELDCCLCMDKDLDRLILVDNKNNRFVEIEYYDDRVME